MTLPDGLAYVPVTEADLRDLYELDLWAFPSPFSIDQYLKLPVPFEYDRAVAIKDGDGTFAAMNASYGFKRFPVPGAEVAASGLTWVAVHPQYRRRGILRAMIERHFAECQQNGEAISVLTAAEPTIYGRFGYGAAAYDLRAKFSRGAALRPVSLPDAAAHLNVRIENFEQAKHEQLVEDLHRAAGRNVAGTGLNRPGWAARETRGLLDNFHTTVDIIGGREPARIVIIERAGEPVGYARFRRKMEWQDTGPSGSVNAGEVIALDPAASAKLWSVLLDFDLTTEVSSFIIPVDDPIVNQLENNRSISMTHVDNVWVRIIDAAQALAQRQYAADVDVVLELTDPQLPANNGRYRVAASAFSGPDAAATASVTPTNTGPDLILNIRELGAAYLGGVTLAALAAAGHIEVRNPRKLAEASTAFGWPHAPVSSWVF